MQFIIDSLTLLLPLLVLYIMYIRAVEREKSDASRLYIYIRGGIMREIKPFLENYAFTYTRSKVIATSIERAVQFQQLAVLNFLLSPELKLVTNTQKVDSYLHEKSLKGGLVSKILWRWRVNHIFEPWRDLSEADKEKLRVMASEGEFEDPIKGKLKCHLGQWSVN